MMKKILASICLLGTVNSFAQCDLDQRHDTSFFNLSSIHQIAQSFTTTCTGYLDYIQMYADAAGTNLAGTLNIYQGSSVTSTVLYSQPYSAFVVLNENDSMRVDLTTSLPITVGTQYTFEFTAVDIARLDVDWNDPYAGGNIFDNGTSAPGIDLDFKIGITSDVSIANNQELATIELFPNPASNNIQLIASNVESVQLFNIVGEKVGNYAANTTSIDVSNLPTGVYFIQVEMQGGAVTKRFIKQ